MGGSKLGLWLFLVLSLSTGCWLDDEQEEDGQSNASPAEPSDSGDQNGGGSDQPSNGEPDDGNGSEPSDNNGSNGDGNTGDSEPDSGSTGMTDSGTVGGGEDASATGGEEDSSMPEPDAGPPDAGSSEPDADVEEDAGPPIVVPDLGDASMSDTERAVLIANYLTAEGYTTSWYPLLQTEAVQRPLLLTTASHGISVRAFQNPVAKQAMDEWVDGELPLPLTMPNGSVLVKETYKLDAMQMPVPNGTLVMAKIDALDPAMYEGKWFFMRIDTANVAKRGATCVNCHNGRTALSAWPINMETNPMGGSPNALVPYDYMFIPYCYDQRTPECVGPN